MLGIIASLHHFIEDNRLIPWALIKDLNYLRYDR